MKPEVQSSTNTYTGHWCRPRILGLERWTQEDHWFKIVINYSAPLSRSAWVTQASVSINDKHNTLIATHHY